jgi:two-component SAPR family response regulator
MVVIERASEVPLGAEERSPHEEQLRDVLAELARTVGLLVFAIGLAAAFWWLLGPPHVPSPLPSLDRIREVLMGSELPEPVVIEATSLIGWAVIGYLLVVVVLRLLVLTVLATVGATRAVRGAVRIIDLLTLPPVRRLTDGVLAGVLMTSAWLSPPARARASMLGTTRALPSPTAPAPELTFTPPALSTEASLVLGSEHVSLAFTPRRMALTYTVVLGDTLWRIAERVYGDGHRFSEIAAANAGRAVAPGVVFGDPNVLHPGWELLVPLPAEHVGVDAIGMTYAVQEGDSLWGIAARLLGDGQRWREIWDLNEAHDLGGGRRFTNAGILLPGWTLRLPPADVVPLPEPLPAPVPAPAPPPALPAPPPATERPVASPPSTPPAVTVPEPPYSRDDRSVQWPPDREVAVVVAAGVAMAGVAALAAHRRRGRPTTGPGGHAGHNPASDRRGRRRTEPVPGDVERIGRTARLTLTALRELGCEGLRFLLCREERDAVTLRVACMPGEVQALIGTRFTLGRRLDCLVDAHAVAGHQVELTVSGLRREAAALLPDVARDAPALLLVPVGADAAGIHYLNLAGLASVGVHGTSTETSGLLRGWLATLAATVAADQYLITAPEEMPWLTAAEVPRWRDPLPGTNSDLLIALEAEIAGRLTGEPPASPLPVILALLGVDGLRDADRLETLVRRGWEAGIHLVLWEENTSSAVEKRAPLAICEATVTFASAADGEEVAPGTLVVRLAGQSPMHLRPVAIPEEGPVPAQGPEAADAEDAAAVASGPQPSTDGGPLPVYQEPVDAPIGDLTDVGPDEPIDDTAPVSEAVARHAPRPEEPDDEGESDELRRVGDDDRWVAPGIPGQAEPAPSPITPRQLALVDDPTASGGGAAGERAEPRITVRCLGAFEVELHGVPITNWKSVKARELLAYLVAHGETPVPREDAWAALWPDGEPGQMQRLLSSAAYHIRRTIKEVAGEEAEPLITQDARYRLRSALFHVDRNTFDARLRRAASLAPVDALIEYERALALYRGRLFGAEPFDWAGGQRQEYEGRFQAAAHAAAKVALQCRDPKRAAGFYQLILDREPTDEEAARGLMSCLASQGDRGGVRKVYKAVVVALRREFDDPTAEPLPETVTLLRELTQGS